jgi:hypothetical protein
LAAKDTTMEDVTRLDIQRDGLSQAQPLASARTGSEQRHKEYMAHIDRMDNDPEYRMKWEQRERDMEEAKQRNYYY